MSSYIIFILQQIVRGSKQRGVKWAEYSTYRRDEDFVKRNLVLMQERKQPLLGLI
jgi:hypothetical protein